MSKDLSKWITIICEQCGKMVEKRIVNVNGKKHSFCCRACSQEYIAHNRAKRLNCKICGAALKMGEGYYGTVKKNRSYICDKCAIDIKEEKIKRKIKSKILNILNKYAKNKSMRETVKKSIKFCIDCGKELSIARRLKNITLCKKCKEKVRRRNCPQYMVNQRMKTAVNKALSGKKAGRKWERLAGYTVEDLMTRLEGLFSVGMSWENMGAWHIDHIIPKSSFDYKDAGDSSFKKAWALDNLQPLWAIDNMCKHASMPGDKCFICVEK